MHIHIVGLGLAGSLLAWELRALGVRVTAEDEHDPESSSRVAAGMITPITGRRLKPTWRAGELTRLALDTYSAISREIDRPLMRAWRLRRVFREAIQMEWFHARERTGEYAPITVAPLAPGVHQGVHYPHGGFEHDGVYTVDMSALVDAMRLEPDGSGADLVVWCTGVAAHVDPRWSWLPLEPSKGEILDVVIRGYGLDHILTNGTWILPVGEDRYRVGATHDWDDHDPHPTEKGRAALLAAIEPLVSHPIEIVGHRAAIRPSTRYKRPLVGRHPVDSAHAIFTGLGTKGALQGPWAARQLARHLVVGEPLDPDIDIQRWWRNDV
jgi:glycine/D-amino acid oxidase-like deaminating enzyme